MRKESTPARRPGAGKRVLRTFETWQNNLGMVGEHHIDAKALHAGQDITSINNIDTDAQMVTMGVVYHAATDHPPAAEDAHCTDSAGESRCPPGNIPHGLDKNPQGNSRRLVRKNGKETMVKR
jgi:hypothetical protein